MSQPGIIVLGAPRSGTTLLRRVLDAHPNIAAPGETYLLTACARFLAEDKVVDGMDIGVLNGLGFLGFEGGDVVSRLREFAFGFREDHAWREGKGRWCEKTAVDAFHVPAIERLCGDEAQFICVVRHGVDVALSMLDWTVKAQAMPPELHDYMRMTPRPVEAFAMAWADATASVTDFAERHPENAVLLRYEDFVAAPDVELKRVLDAVGEPFDEGILTRAFEAQDPKGFSDWRAFAQKSMSSKSIDRWKTLSPATLGALAPIVNPMLERHGYKTLKEGKARSREDARRRYNMGLMMQAMKDGEA